MLHLRKRRTLALRVASKQWPGLVPEHSLLRSTASWMSLQELCHPCSYGPLNPQGSKSIFGQPKTQGAPTARQGLEDGTHMRLWGSSGPSSAPNFTLDPALSDLPMLGCLLLSCGCTLSCLLTVMHHDACCFLGLGCPPSRPLLFGPLLGEGPDPGSVTPLPPPFTAVVTLNSTCSWQVSRRHLFYSTQCP